ncbi:MAG: cytochrome c3 family protein [Phycisphaerae bacterium]
MAIMKKWRISLCLSIGCVIVLLSSSGCQPPPADVFFERNTTDPTNKGASYIGSGACQACHPTIGAQHTIHGHSQILKKLASGSPSYAPEGIHAGVPNPPVGATWSNLTYVIGGYIRKANFINSQGYIMTDGVDKVNTQWNLDFPPNGTVAGWGAYEHSATIPKSYSYNCFFCHMTGPNQNGHQDSLSGVGGTFSESGVQCENCHGPGSNHVPNPPANIYINSESTACGTCHSRGVSSEISGLAEKDVILAQGGFIQNHEQYQELLASPHANIRCVTCHDPHISTVYESDQAIINTCQSCHPDKNIPLHDGTVFVRGDYVEKVTCVSCHMPYATRSATSAPPAVVGLNGQQGDIKTHIWFINTDQVNYTAMFSADGSTVLKDANGHGAVTLDFVCLRCHSDVGSAFKLTIKSAADIALGMHDTGF